MQEGYWFVKLCEDAAPNLQKVKARVLLFMQKLRKDLGKDVYLYQFDTTGDYCGYFYCDEPKEFATKFEAIGL